MSSLVGLRPSLHWRGFLSVAGLLLLVTAAGCDAAQPGASRNASTSSVSAQPSSTGPNAVFDLAYGFAPGDAYRYEVRLEQHIVLATEGEASAVLDGEIPGSADVTVVAEGVFVYTVTEGAEKGTLEVTISGEFDDVSFEGSADGQPVDGAEDIAQLGSFDPFTTTIVVDQQGRLVNDQGQDGDIFSLGGSTFAGLSGDLGQLPGPVLADEPVRVGDVWSATYDDSSLGDDPVEVQINAELVGVDRGDLGEFLVIKSESASGEATTDLADLFASFFVALDDESTSGGANGTPDGIVFRIVTSPSTSTTTSDFDSERGLTLNATTTGQTGLTMEVALPGSEPDELEEFSMNLQTDQTLRYRLVGDAES